MCRVSIVAQDDGSEEERSLDGDRVTAIHSDLTRGLDLTSAGVLAEGAGLAHTGAIKGGAFDIPGDIARGMLRAPTNINGRTNADVVVPWVNGLDLTRRSRDMFMIDFGWRMTEAEASAYEAPFAHVEEYVRPVRANNREKARRDLWWRHRRSGEAMRAALAPLSRFHRHTNAVEASALSSGFQPQRCPDHQLVAIARADDYAFGVLHSQAHELWALRMGTSLEDRPRYTPSSTFETFPFPWPLNTPDEALTAQQRECREAISAAARALGEARRRWLNPPEWVREEPDVLPSLPPRLLPVDEDAESELRKRTLTTLYNVRPAWLSHRHAALDAAVLAAYGWPEADAPDSLSEEELLARLLGLNLARGG